MNKNDLNIELVSKKDFTRLLEENRWYIYKLAKNMAHPEYMKDFTHLGSIGLFKAMNKYDSSKNIPFIRFASFYIKGEMFNFLTNNSRTIKIPHYVVNLILSDTEERLTDCGRILPTKHVELIDDYNTENEVEPEKDFTALYEVVNSSKYPDMLKAYFGLEPYEREHTLIELGKIHSISGSLVMYHVKQTLKKLSKNQKLKNNYK